MPRKGRSMQYVAPLLPYATLMTVLMGLVFGVLSVRQWQRARALSVAAELVKSLQGQEFTRCIAVILELPEKADAGVVLNDASVVSAAYVVGHVFEGLGVLVFYRLLPLDMVEHLVGGYLRASWTRLKPYIERRRVVLGPSFAEWFEWLADRLCEQASRKDVGAAVAYRNWH
jgi:hypothetical protein